MPQVAPTVGLVHAREGVPAAGGDPWGAPRQRRQPGVRRRRPQLCGVSRVGRRARDAGGLVSSQRCWHERLCIGEMSGTGLMLRVAKPAAQSLDGLASDSQASMHVVVACVDRNKLHITPSATTPSSRQPSVCSLSLQVAFVEWLCAQLRRPAHQTRAPAAACNALGSLLREGACRQLFTRAGGALHVHVLQWLCKLDDALLAHQRARSISTVLRRVQPAQQAVWARICSRLQRSRKMWMVRSSACAWTV